MKQHLSAHLRSFGLVNRWPVISCVVWIALLGSILLAQSDASGSSNSGAAFAGMWKGVCQDGKPFILLTLRSASNEIVGTVSLGNVKLGNSAGDKGGACTVADPADREHSMAVTNAAVNGQKLTFEASRGPQVEMTLANENTAKLRFPGTPMEDVSFEIHKQ